MRLGIVGHGFVGKASCLLKNSQLNVLVYDINPELCVPRDTTLNNIAQCDIILICVPTPMNKNGSTYLDIIESVIYDLKKIKPDHSDIIIRSTVPPGTSEKFNVFFMPEFLTEKNYTNDFINNKLWIFGLTGDTVRDENFKTKISFMIDSAYIEDKILYNNITWMTNTEAEMVKYFRNTMLAVKLSYCNELYDFCRRKGLDYDNIRKIAALDERIGLSHTQVPGNDGLYGFGGTCFPKDAHGLLYEMNNVDMKSYILESAIKRNYEIDRKEKDWEKLKGRSIV